MTAAALARRDVRRARSMAVDALPHGGLLMRVTSAAAQLYSRQQRRATSWGEREAQHES
jgi:hypothetical protein